MTQSDSNSIYHFISTAKDVDDLLYIENYFTNRPLTKLLPKKNILLDLHRIHDDILNTPAPNVGHTKGLLGIIKCMQQFSFPKDDGQWINELESFTHLINKSIRYITTYLEVEDTFNNIYEKILDIVINAAKCHPALKTKMLLCLSPAIFDIGIKRMLPVYLFKKSVNCLISMVTRTEPEKRKEVMEVVYPKLSQFFDQLYTCGDFDTQLNVVEAILRYIVPDKNRKQFLSYFKHKSPELIRKFLSIRGKDFDMDCRLFLNYINKSQGEQALVVSVPCYSVLLDEMSIEKPPEHQLFWVDFNRRSHSLSIWCNKNSLLTEEEQTIAEYLSTTDWLSIVITPDTVKEVEVKSPDSQSGLHRNFKEVLFYIDDIITIKPLSNLKCSKSKCIHIVFPISKDTEGLDEKILFEIFPSKKQNNVEQGDITVSEKSNGEDKTSSNKYYLESKSRKNVQMNKHADSVLLKNNPSTNVSSSQRQVRKEIEVKEVKKVSVTTFIKFQQKWENKNQTPQFGCEVAQSIKSVSHETFIASQTEENENILNNSRLRSPKMLDGVDICKVNYLENTMRRKKEFGGSVNGIPLDQWETHCRNVTVEGENPGEESDKCNHNGKVSHVKEHKEHIPHIESKVIPVIDKQNVCSEAQVACGQLNITADSNKQESIYQYMHQTHVKMYTNNEITSKNEALKCRSTSTAEQLRKTVKIGETENNTQLSVARPTSMLGLHSSEQNLIYHHNDTKPVQKNHDVVETRNRFEECSTNLRKETEMTNSDEVQTPKLPLPSMSEQKATIKSKHFQTICDSKNVEEETLKKPKRYYIKAAKNPLNIIIAEDKSNYQVDHEVMKECLNEDTHCKNHNKEQDVKMKSKNNSRISKKANKLPKVLNLIENLNSNGENPETCGPSSVDIVQKSRKLRRSMRLLKKTVKNEGNKIIQDKYMVEQLKQSLESNIQQNGEENLEKMNNYEKLPVHAVKVQENEKEPTICKRNNCKKETKEMKYSENFDVKKCNQNKLTKREVQERDEKSKVSTHMKLNLCEVNSNAIKKKIHPFREVDTEIEMITNLSENQGINSETIRRTCGAWEKYPTPNEGLFNETQETSEETKTQNRIEESKKSLLEINETKHNKIDSLMKVFEGNPEHINEKGKQMKSLNYAEPQAVDTLNGNKISENSTNLPLTAIPNINSNMNYDDNIRSLEICKANKNYQVLEVFPKTAVVSREKTFIKELDNNKHENMEEISKSNCSLKFNKNSLKQDPRNPERFKNKRDRVSNISKAYLREGKGDTFSNSPKTSYNPDVQLMKESLVKPIKEDKLCGGQNNVSKSVVFNFFTPTSASKPSKATKLSTLDDTVDKKKNKNLPQSMVIDEIKTTNHNDDFQGTDNSMNDFKTSESALLMSKKKFRKSLGKETMINKIQTTNTKKSASKSMKNNDLNEHFHSEQSSTRHLRKRKAISYMGDSSREECAFSLLKRNKENIYSLESNQNPIDQKVKGRRSVKRKLFTNNQEDIVSVCSASQSSSSKCNQVLKLKYPVKHKENTPKKFENEVVQDEFDLIIASAIPPLPRKVNYWEEKFRKEREASIMNSSKSVISKSQKRLHSVYSDFESDSDVSFNGFKVPVTRSKKTYDSIQASSECNTTDNIYKYKHEEGGGVYLTSPERLRGNKSPDVCPSPQSSSFSSSSYIIIGKVKENKTKTQTNAEREREQLLENNMQKPNARNRKMSKKSENLRKKLMDAQTEITKKKINDFVKNNSSSEENIKHEGIPQYSVRGATTDPKKVVRKANKLIGCNGRKEGHEVTVILEESTTLTKYSKEKTSPNGGDTSPNGCIQNQFDYNFGRDADGIQCNHEKCSKKADGVATAFSPEVEYVKQPEINIRKKKKHVLRKTCMSNKNKLEDDDNTNSEEHVSKLIPSILGKDVSSQYNLEKMTDLNNSNSESLKLSDINITQFDYQLDKSDDKSSEEMKEQITSDENLIAEKNVCSSSKMRKINVTNTGKIVSQVKHTIHHYKECHNASAYVSATPSANKNTKSSSSPSISELAEELQEEEEDQEEEESIPQNYSMNFNSNIMKVQFTRFLNEKLKHINAFSKNTANAFLNKLSEASTSFVQESSSNRKLLEDTVFHNVEKIENEIQDLDSYEEFLNRMKSEFMSVTIKQNVNDQELKKGFSNILGAYETFVSVSKIDNHFNVQDLLTSLKRSYQKHTLKDMLQKFRKIYDMSP